VWLRGVRTDTPFKPEPSLENQRPAEYVFEKQVTTFLTDDEVEASRPRAKAS
jgi:hypothetical protein